MHAHFVLAHPEPQSFNARLVRSGSAALEDEGWTVSVSDLSMMGFCAALPRVAERQTIPFNRMEEWGPDGRIRPGAPVHSAFIRRKRRLDLE
jgi:putative NADPH-quinone reductase